MLLSAERSLFEKLVLGGFCLWATSILKVCPMIYLPYISSETLFLIGKGCRLTRILNGFCLMIYLPSISAEILLFFFKKGFWEGFASWYSFSKKCVLWSTYQVWFLIFPFIWHSVIVFIIFSFFVVSSFLAWRCWVNMSKHLAFWNWNTKRQIKENKCLVSTCQRARSNNMYTPFTACHCCKKPDLSWASLHVA